MSSIRPLRRLKSKSFDDGSEMIAQKRKGSLGLRLPPMKQPPPPILQWRGSLLMWKVNKSCEVLIYLHRDERRILEVVAVDHSDSVSKELNRLYVPLTVLETVVRSLPCHKPHASARRSNLTGSALLKHCIDYVIETLDCVEKNDIVESSSGIKSPTKSFQMRLQRYDGSKQCIADLTTTKPLELSPVSIPRVILACNNAQKMTADDVGKEVYSTFRRISWLTKSAMGHLNLANPDDVYRRLIPEGNSAVEQQPLPSPSNQNPNVYSSMRWKWIWTINQVVHQNRMKTITKDMKQLQCKKRMTVGMSHSTEYDQLVQMAASARKAMHNQSKESCTSQGLLPGFRQYSVKSNDDDISPMFKVSVDEIYRKSNVKPKSFTTSYDNIQAC